MRGLNRKAWAYVADGIGSGDAARIVLALLVAVAMIGYVWPLWAMGVSVLWVGKVLGFGVCYLID